MSEKTCGTCDFYQYPSRQGGYGNCLRIDLLWDEHDDEIDDIAVVVDHDQYHAELLCKPDFGCVLHEPKPPATDPAPG